MRANRTSKLIVILCTCFGFVTHLATAQTSVEHLSVSSGRPVADAVRSLEQKYGFVITYEDPQYVHPADLKDITPRWYVPANHPQNRQRILAPRGGSLNFSYQVKGGKPLENTSDLLTRLVNSYGVGRNAEFSVHKATVLGVTEWHIIPARALGQGGQLVNVSPILDTSISIPNEKRTGLDMIGTVCKELTRITHQRIALGVVPLNPLYAYNAVQGADNQPARDVLADTLARIRPGLSWQLFYDPSGFYMLNIHWAEDSIHSSASKPGVANR